MRTIRIAWIAALVCVLFLPATLLGQGGYTAALRGLITDTSGAAVPGAKVTITDVTRGTDFKTESDGQGRYTVTQLPPSTYILTVKAPGFKTYQRNPFELRVQQQATINVGLEVGEVATVVEVQATQPLLNTTIATLGQVIDNKYILDLPILSRNPMALVYLTPGVVRAGGKMGGQENTNFVANGARNASSDVLLDGSSVTVVEQNSGIHWMVYKPTVDAVQEMKVQTNFFSAEYGETGSAIVNMVTKSGTNEFHGTGYYFYQADELNANSFFSNRAGRGKVNTRLHHFGGVIGGPIKKDKAFFFFTYDRSDSKRPISVTSTWPTAQQRGGDFSDYFDPSGEMIQIFNPFNTYTNANGDIKRLPFSGNIVPQSMIDPIALNATKWFPQPNQPGDPITHEDNYFAQGANSGIANQIDNKIDWNISDNNRVTGRYSVKWGGGRPDNLMGAGNMANPWNRGPSASRNQNLVGDFTRTQNATTIITVRGSWIRNRGDRKPFGEFSPSKLGFPKYMDTNADFLTFPRFQPEGYTGLGTAGWLIIENQQDVFQFSGNVTKIMGGHNLKVGGEFHHNDLTWLQPGYPSGKFRFSRQTTREDRFQGNSLQGNGLASMLLGWGAGGSNYSHEPKSFSRGETYAFYVQDDWKIARKLTINLGLRYSFDRPRWEKYNRYDYWDMNTPSPINDQVPEYNLKGVYKFVGGDNPRSPFNGDYNNFGPRIGFAYAVNDKTSIRAGAGMFYSLSQATVKGGLSSGFHSTSSVEWSRDDDLTQYAFLNNPYPNGMNLPVGRSEGAGTFLGLDASPVFRENRNPVYQSWNFSVQRQLTPDTMLEVNYTGSKGTHLQFTDTNLSRLNPIYWGMGRTALTKQVANPFQGVITDPKSPLSAPTIALNHLLRPMPQYTGASRGESSVPTRGDSSYNALQIQFEKRSSYGLVMLANYTWAKMIDDTSHNSGDLDWLGGATSVQDWYNLRNERSLSAHDVAHRFVMTAIYQIPVGTGRVLGTDWNRMTNALLGGWEISGIWTMQTGVPMEITQNGGKIWDATQRPNLIGNPDPGLSTKEKFDRQQWFNPAAFTRPGVDQYGSAPRTINYRTPGLHNLDFAIFKNFQINESKRFQFRCEMNNATNVVTFRGPKTSFGSTSFGRITNYASGRGPRKIQLGLKFYF